MKTTAPKLSRQVKRQPAVEKQLIPPQPLEPLAESEWNFCGQGFRPPSAWQWNHWINYEYARESNLIKDAVEELRHRPIEVREVGTYPKQAGVPPFAAYLKQYYPQFPTTPWRDLPEESRAFRLQEQGGSHSGDPFEEDVLKTYDVENFATQIATGEISIGLGQMQAERMAVFEIDFRQGDTLIRRKFSDWLASRREELNKSHSIKPSRQRMNVGQRGNSRTYKNALSSLAAHRLMNHYKDDFLECTVVTEEVLGKPLYSGASKTSWTGPKTRAADILRRFEISWRDVYYPSFIFTPDHYYETIRAFSLGRPFSAKRSHKRKS